MAGNRVAVEVYGLCVGALPVSVTEAMQILGVVDTVDCIERVQLLANQVAEIRAKARK
jgi:hypothetical protein